MGEFSVKIRRDRNYECIVAQAYAGSLAMAVIIMMTLILINTTLSPNAPNKNSSKHMRRSSDSPLRDFVTNQKSIQISQLCSVDCMHFLFLFAMMYDHIEINECINNLCSSSASQ